MEYFPGVFGDLILWEETALYYSPNGGAVSLTLFKKRII